MTLADWIGSSQIVTDTLIPLPAQKLAATLNRPAPTDTLPPTWQWIYFTPTVALADTGSDGHAKRGGFLPPIDLPRRMWAGGRLTYTRPLHMGDTIEKTSTVIEITEKQGKSGRLVFVVVRHEFRDQTGIALVEDQDIVYREAPRSDQPPPPRQPVPADPEWSREIDPNPVLLFRYSALTFNSHRIHYDLNYCQAVEGYPGLVVHGPLTATLLLEAMPPRPITYFSFRAISPLFDTARFRVEGRLTEQGATVWARTPDGYLAMEGTVQCA